MYKFAKIKYGVEFQPDEIFLENVRLQNALYGILIFQNLNEIKKLFLSKIIFKFFKRAKQE